MGCVCPPQQACRTACACALVACWLSGSLRLPTCLPFAAGKGGGGGVRQGGVKKGGGRGKGGKQQRPGKARRAAMKTGR